MTAYKKLKLSFSQLSHFDYLHSIVYWDEAVMMPEGAGASRADAMAAFATLLQKKLVNKKNKALIAAAKTEELSEWDKANLHWMEKKYLSASCIPSKLNEKLTKETMLCQQVWRKLRAKNNWREFLPHFDRLFKLVKEVAERKGAALNLNPYDALLDEYAPGFNQKKIDAIFHGIQKDIPPLINKISQKQAAENRILPEGNFSIEAQKQLGLSVMQAMQFDFHHGRLDVSHHPFCGGYPLDVRITTRYTDHEFLSSLLGICHETGHGLYEQGLPKEWIDQPVGRIHSMAMHESQSLLIERQVCGSKAFATFLLPKIIKSFGKQAAFTEPNLYKLISQVKPGLIRVDADEVTYPLHVVLRYELEKGLINGDITPRDLPACWDELMQKYLGLSTKENDRDGVMQDVHWPSGAFGYFPAYTLGRLIAAQLFASFIEANPKFHSELAVGNFKTLHEWLQQNVYSQASYLPTDDLLMKVTGRTLDARYFIRHVESQYL
jgi:carboxypeptidase Taq